MTETYLLVTWHPALHITCHGECMARSAALEAGAGGGGRGPVLCGACTRPARTHHGMCRCMECPICDVRARQIADCCGATGEGG
jgi:hypothetical protein